MRVFQLRRKELITTVGFILVISCIAMLQYAVTGKGGDLTGYVKYPAVDNLNTFKLYEDATAASPIGPTLHKKVQREGTQARRHLLFGSIVDSRGIVASITHNVTSELVFSFSPTAEEHFKAKLVDPNHEQQVYANSPAMIWDGKKFIVIMRMWLDQEHTIKKTKNVFSDNYLYTRTYNDKMDLETLGECEPQARSCI